MARTNKLAGMGLPSFPSNKVTKEMTADQLKAMELKAELKSLREKNGTAESDPNQIAFGFKLELEEAGKLQVLAVAGGAKSNNRFIEQIVREYITNHS